MLGRPLFPCSGKARDTLSALARTELFFELIQLSQPRIQTMKKFLLALGTAALIGSSFLGMASAAPVEQGSGGFVSCFCLASYTINKSADCDCTLQIVDLSWLASPNCAPQGATSCPGASDLKCEIMANFEEVGECGGYWPNTRIRTGCESSKVIALDCDGGGSHFVRLICNPCKKI